MAMTDDKATRVLCALDEDESRPRYCSDAGASDLRRLNAEAIRHALVALADRKALVECDLLNTHCPGLEPLGPILYAARRHMEGEE